MTTQSLVPLAILASSIAAFAATPVSDSKPLQVYPKNLARQHVGANIFLFNATRQEFATTEASAAWLDDDVTTGWPVMAGQQFYLLALPEPEVMTNFAISTRPTEGTVTLYAGDEPAAPGAKSWTTLVKDVPVESVNHKKLAKPLSRFAKYLLIETNIADPGPVYSLYLYGERPAVSYVLTKRETPLDTRAIFGYVNEQTAISSGGLYVGSRIASAPGTEGAVAMQKPIDENPESAISIAPNAETAGLVLKFQDVQPVSRVALLTSAPAKGQLGLFVVPSIAPEATTPASLAGLTPTMTMALDGTTVRQALDFPETTGGALLVRWTPESGSDAIAIRELNVFSGHSLSEYALGMTPEAVAELAKNDDPSKDGKAFADGKEAKGGLEPVGELRQSRTPYLPGALGFPPNITTRVPPPLPPELSP